ncbi:MAG: helix-turn-helix domain containing protein [Clostridiales bacterium]|nr:helix-turn-helix domain containing protein [Clostridiales bacterium]
MRLKGKELEERNAKIIKQYKLGATNKEISNICSVSYSTVCNVIKKYVQDNDGSNKIEKNGIGIDDIVQSEDEESIYLDTLYSYTKSFININECAIDGMEISKLKQKVARTKDAFKILSGMEIEPVIETRNSDDNGRKFVVDQKILYSGWLRCPNCGKKLHKVFENTSMNNFPLWCKQCHKTTIINM